MSSNIIIVEQKGSNNKFSPQSLASSRNSVYFRMLKAGVSREAVKQKMIVLGRIERALAENLIDYLVALLNNEENFDLNIEKNQVEKVHRSTLKKSTKKPSPNSPKLTEKDVESCSYFRMLKSGVPTGAVIQKMVVLERINPKEAEKTVNTYLELLNAPKEVQSKQKNENFSEISQGNLNSFFQMLKSGVPSLAVKQKMIVLHKISSEKADQIIDHFFTQINHSSDQFFSENIINIDISSSSSYSASFDRPQFKSDFQSSGKSEIKLVEIKENNNGKGKFNVKFNEEKNQKNQIRVPKYDTYFQMIKVGMKSDVVKQRMKIDGVSIEKLDQIVNEIFDRIISMIGSSVQINQKYYGEKLYRSMVEAGVPLNAVYHRMTVIDKLLPDVADRFLNSIESIHSY